MTDATISALRETLTDLPGDSSGPVFREPWEAEAFAMAIALYERGLFTWSEWAATLSDVISEAQKFGDPDTGESYYHHWLKTLETLVIAKGVTGSDALHTRFHQWERAARATPHGQPIVLENDPRASHERL